VPTDDRADAKTRYRDCHPFVVEDDQNFRLLIARALEKAGVPKDRIRTFPDGEQAIAAIQKLNPGSEFRADLQPSIILLDVSLPKKSGLDVLAWIKECPTLRIVPVFMLTSSEHPDHISRAFELRTDSYFIKPPDITELQTIVESMLGFWHTRSHRRLPGSSMHLA
jgi:DNA-binding response OmpR family regulator